MGGGGGVLVGLGGRCVVGGVFFGILGKFVKFRKNVKMWVPDHEKRGRKKMTFFWVFLSFLGIAFRVSGDTKKVCAELSKFWCFFESRIWSISKKPNPECTFFSLPSLLFLRNGEEGLFNTCHFFGFFDNPGIDVFGVGISRFGWTNFGGGVSKNAKKRPPRSKKVLPRGPFRLAQKGYFVKLKA